MIDSHLSAINERLLAKLPELKFAYGKAQRMVIKTTTGQMSLPVIYVQKDEYKPMTPDANKEAFCFWHIFDPIEIINNHNRFKAKFSLIFWFDLSAIYTDGNNSTDELKTRIYNVLKNVFPIKLTGIYEKADNIYKEYGVKEIDTQFNTYPYAALRFDGDLTFEDCGQ